jgi:hypothetical protein
MLAMANATPATAASTSTHSLSASGYTLLPEPQRVRYAGKQFQFGSGWHLRLESHVEKDNMAVEILRQDLARRFGLHIATGAVPVRDVTLEIIPSSVAIAKAVAVAHTADRNTAALASQAYRLTLSPQHIQITATTSTGLFYGAETLVQLINKTCNTLKLPEATIIDWPDVRLRNVFWDDSEHLDRLSTLKAAIRKAAFFKANAFVLKLDGHFQYQSAPAVVDPEALSADQLQQLTDYALRYHVQLIPYIDGPAHSSWILKHPEYAKLREYPHSNYEFCTTNSKTYRLLEGMYRELLKANQGVDDFVLSTDEPYYVGEADNRQCHEGKLAKRLGSRGKVEARFLDKSAGFIHQRGRAVQFWGEYPIKPDDIPSLPAYLINGETDKSPDNALYAAHGIRQEIYTSTQGVEYLFPTYYPMPKADLVNKVDRQSRLKTVYDAILSDPVRQQSNLMGVFVAAWADSGLHPATFWLGFAAGSAWAWHPGAPRPDAAAERFYKRFYGQNAKDMLEVYQLMSAQAEFYETSWDWGPSDARIGIWGNSEGRFIPRRPAKDQSIPLPGIPQADSLQVNYDWSVANARRLRLARRQLPNNKKLLQLLAQSQRSALRNRYNLQVFTSIAKLERQNLTMIAQFGQIDRSLKRAHSDAVQGRAKQAVAALDHILHLAERVRQQRNQALHQAVATWDKSWCPPQREECRYQPRNAATQRSVRHQAKPIMSDVKDHLPARTQDMSYLIYRELLLPMNKWFNEVRRVRNRYAKAHGVRSQSNATLHWKSYRDYADSSSTSLLIEQPDHSFS